jgi:hypothetical protein
VKVSADNLLPGMLSDFYQFWHTYGSDIQNGAVVLSAIAAFWVIAESKATARRRATMDLILHQESDKELIAERIAFNAIKSGTVKVATFASNESRNSSEFSAIRKILNLHELTAVAINEGVIDERVYRRWFNTTYVADYEATKNFIRDARITYDNEAAFSEFEQTAIRWKEDTNWPPKPGWFRRKWRALRRVTYA